MKHTNPEMGHLVALVRQYGASEKAQEFFATMTDRKWEKWQPRYKAILDGKGIALDPPMTWWEKEFHQSMELGKCVPGSKKPVQ
jgi:hypothetical protein